MTFLLGISAAFLALLISLLNRNMISEGYVQGEVEMDCLLLKLVDILTMLQV